MAVPDLGGQSWPVDHELTDGQRQAAILAAGSALLGLLVGIPPLGPFIVYLVVKNSNPFAAHAALQALSFSLVLTLIILAKWCLVAASVCVIGPFIALLAPLAGLVAIGAVIALLTYSIVAMVHASNSRYYAYPVTANLLPAF